MTKNENDYFKYNSVFSYTVKDTALTMTDLIAAILKPVHK